MDSETAKHLASVAAVEFVPEEGVIGLGTGTTTRHFIIELARKVAEGRRLVGVPTSRRSHEFAKSLGIPLLDDSGPWNIDICVDGADEVSDALDLIKGGGGAHTREKIVNRYSRKNVIIVDDSKLSRRLGEKWAVPVEVVLFGHRATASALAHFGKATLRLAGDHPLVTDSGNYIYDLATGPIEDPRALDEHLRRVPGVLETGLFCGRADVVIVAGESGVELRYRDGRREAKNPSAS